MFALAINSDGAWFATASRDTVWIWDSATRARRAILDSAFGITALAIAPDGSWLATGGYGSVRIWDTASWAQTAAFPWQRGACDSDRA